MTSDYIKVELKSLPSGGYCFDATADFILDNFYSPFQNVKVKIDTGCAVSTIPVQKLEISPNICKKLKKKDIRNDVYSMRSYGVETGGKPHKVPVTRQQKYKCEALKFRHGISDFFLNDVPIPISSIFLNYNRKGNMLIGMDILSQLDIHIGISKIDDTILLLACPRNNISKNYIKALRDHFGILKFI